MQTKKYTDKRLYRGYVPPLIPTAKRRSTAFVQLGLVAALLGLGACEVRCNTGAEAASLRSAKAADAIKKMIMTDAGVDIDVKCPKIELESETVCIATTKEGLSFPVEVTTTDTTISVEMATMAAGPKIEETIKRKYKSAFAFVFDAVECPKLIERADTTASCTGTADGVEIPMRLVFSESGVEFMPTSGLITGASVVSAIRTGLRGPHSVDCGFMLRASRPGAQFTCDLVDSAGKQSKKTVTIKDTDGTLDIGDAPMTKLGQMLLDGVGTSPRPDARAAH